MKQNNSRAQGTIEYLVIIAVVVVIALVVVALVLNMSDSDSTQIISNKNQNLIGKGGISIIDSIMSSTGDGVISLQNTLGENLTIKTIIPGAENNCEKILSPGEKYDCYLTDINSACPCSVGQRVTCEFRITFESKNGLEKSEKFTIINDCTNQSITNPDSSLSISLTSPNAGTIITSPDTNTNFTFRANRITTDCNLYIKVGETRNFAERRTQTTPKNTPITIDANVASFGTSVNSWKIKCADETNNTGESIDREITYSPETQPTTYTVTFDSQGGSSINPITDITSGATITLPTNPTKTGYTFLEWNTQSNGSGSQFTESTPVTQNITIYAKWEEGYDCDEPLAGGYFCNGTGTLEDPYGLTTIEMIQNINQNLDANYILLNDINASETSTWNSGNGFVPIGGEWVEFVGSLNGNNFVISDLFVGGEGTWNGYSALFANLGEESQIIDLGIENIQVYGGSYTAGLAGFSTGQIRNVYVTGVITGGGHYCGGLVGSNRGTIEQSYTILDITNPSGYCDYSGGLVGDNALGGEIIESYSIGGTVTGGECVGGLVGRNPFGTITNSYSTNIVSGHHIVGGLTGENWGVIENSYSTGSVVSTISHPATGGLNGYEETSAEYLNSYWDTTTSGLETSVGGTGLTTSQMKQSKNFSGWDFSTIWNITNGTTYPYLRNNTQSPLPQ